MNDAMNMQKKPLAILVGASIKNKTEYDVQVSISELEELAKAAGAEVVGILMQNIDAVNPATYIGKGKVEELAEYVLSLEADLVIVDHELSGSQIRNLENALETQVIDRTTLILDIFAIRAKSKVAKLQVEMAQLKYRLPRLISLESGMSRTGGGIGTRGPGEQKLEIDRRRIREKISDIQKRIKEAQKVRNTQSEQRVKSDIPIVSIAGYTNSGKSTLMNRCIYMDESSNDDKHVLAKDMLFATLDTTNRRIEINENRPFILVDTVGFVSRLPHALVNAFKSTLDEVLFADVILHVVDVSSQYAQQNIQVTNQVLKELGADNIPQIMVYNKIDKINANDTLSESMNTRILDINEYANKVNISAKTGQGMDDLVNMIETLVYSDCEVVDLFIPFRDAGVYDKICKSGKIINTEYVAEGINTTVELDTINRNRYSSYIRWNF